MEAKVDVSTQEGAPGAMLSSVPRTTPVASTTVYDTSLADADERIARIVAGEVLPALKALPAVAAAPAAAAPAPRL
jgi:membrane fusion protein (multidrug efflux system)